MTDRAQAQEKGRGRDKGSLSLPDDKGARVDEAMRISGIRSHLAFVRIRMKQILEEDARVDYDARRWLAQTLDAAFSPEAFARPIRQALLDGYDIELRAYVEFLESDAGKWFFKTVDQGQQALVERAVDKVADDFVATVLTKRVPRPPTPPPIRR